MVSKIQEFLHRTPNKERLKGLDFVKFISIIGMIIGHVFSNVGSNMAATNPGFYYTFIVVISRMLGPTLFMFAMGIGMCYTKKDQPLDFIKRGLFIFIAGYVFNIVYYLPVLLIEYPALGYTVTTNNYIYSFMGVDIMQFAGLAFIFIGLFKLIKTPRLIILIIAIALSITGTFVKDIVTGSAVNDQLLGLLVATGSNELSFSNFPLFNFFIFPVFGYCFGYVLQRVKKINRFYIYSLLVAMIYPIIYCAINIPNHTGLFIDDENALYHIAANEAIMCTLMDVTYLGLFSLLTLLFGKHINKFIEFNAHSINCLYVVHHCLIRWSIMTMRIVNKPNPIVFETYQVFLYILIVYLISLIIAYLYYQLKKITKKKIAKQTAN